MNPIDIRKARAAKAKEMRALIEKAPEGIWSSATEAQFKALSDEVDILERQAKAYDRAEAINADLEKVSEVAPRGEIQNKPDSESKFSCFGEFAASALLQDLRISDERLKPFKAMEMETGNSGGYAVPSEFKPELFELAQANPVFRLRSMVIPAGDSPDAELEFPALNQGTTANNMRGGVVAYWLAEGATITASDIDLRTVKIKPEGVAALVPISNKLLRNWRAADPLIRRLLGEAIIAKEEAAFFSGDGVGKPLGVTKVLAKLTQNRAVANEISFADTVGMQAQSRNLGMNAFYLASINAFTEISQLVDANGNLIWKASARDGEPDRLNGKPLVWSERSSALGTAGDLCLLDLSYYAIKDGSGPIIDSSRHVAFASDKTFVKIVSNVDADCLLSEPITTDGGFQVSPIVILGDVAA